MDKTIKARLIVLGLMALFILFSWWPDVFGDGEPGGGSLAEALGGGVCPEAQLCVAFLDVGQGDSIFIQSPVGIQMLIDGGRDSSVLRELGNAMGFWDKELDYVMVTHPDADHVGGLVGVFDRYVVKQVIRTENESNTEVWRATETAIDEETEDVVFARRGQRYNLGSGVILEILFPDHDVANEESNAASIVAKLIYGDTSFMLTGDSPKRVEEYLVLTDSEYLQSDVLKLGHHGSRTSSSEVFIDEVQPTYAVISAGVDNSYGHPHVEVTDLMFNKRITTLSTAEEGTVVFVSDGSEVLVW